MTQKYVDKLQKYPQDVEKLHKTFISGEIK